MLKKLLQLIKSICFKSFFLKKIISYIYIIINKFYLKNNINIYFENNFWIHKTSIGLIPDKKPIFNSEKYIKKNFDIFFEYYKPKKNDVVVELGAGVGTETLYISKIIGDKGKLIALEPSPEILKLLKTTLTLNKLNNVKIIEKALYKKSTKIGFVDATALGGYIDNTSKELVSTICLDDLVTNHNLNQIDYCKMNIENAEKYITDNSEIFFKLCKNLAIECHDFTGRDEDKTFDIVKKFLISKNYNINYSKRNKYHEDDYYIYASNLD